MLARHPGCAATIQHERACTTIVVVRAVRKCVIARADRPRPVAAALDDVATQKTFRASRDLSLDRPVPACHSRQTRRSARETGRPTSPRSHIIYRRTSRTCLCVMRARGTVCDGLWPGHEWRCLLHLTRSPSRALVGCVPCGSCGFSGASAAVLGCLLGSKRGERCAWLPRGAGVALCAAVLFGCQCQLPLRLPMPMLMPAPAPNKSSPQAGKRGGRARRAGANGPSPSAGRIRRRVAVLLLASVLQDAKQLLLEFKKRSAR